MSQREPNFWSELLRRTSVEQADLARTEAELRGTGDAIVDPAWVRRQVDRVVGPAERPQRTRRLAAIAVLLLLLPTAAWTVQAVLWPGRQHSSTTMSNAEMVGLLEHGDDRTRAVAALQLTNRVRAAVAALQTLSGTADAEIAAAALAQVRSVRASLAQGVARGSRPLSADWPRIPDGSTTAAESLPTSMSAVEHLGANAAVAVGLLLSPATTGCSWRPRIEAALRSALSP